MLYNTSNKTFNCLRSYYPTPFVPPPSLLPPLFFHLSIILFHTNSFFWSSQLRKIVKNLLQNKWFTQAVKKEGSSSFPFSLFHTSSLMYTHTLYLSCQLTHVHTHSLSFSSLLVSFSILILSIFLSLFPLLSILFLYLSFKLISFLILSVCSIFLLSCLSFLPVLSHILVNTFYLLFLFLFLVSQ